MRTAILLVIALLAASSRGFAAGTPQLVPRHLALSVTRPQGSRFTAADALMILRSLHQRLQDADTNVVVVEVPEMPAAATTQEMGTAASAAGADCWMLLTLAGQWTSAQLGITAAEAGSNGTVADISILRTTWVSPASLWSEPWTEAIDAVAGKFPPVRIAATAPEEERARLTITALPGSLISGLGAEPLRIDSTGTGFRDLPAPREYAVRTSLSGYSTISQRVFLSGDRQLAIVQKKTGLWGVDVSLADSRAPGVDLTMAIPRTPFVVQLGFTTYAFALALDSTRLFLTEPLTNIELRAGAYLSPDDRYFRFFLGVGGFARIVHASGTFPMFDPVSPAGGTVLVGTEVPLSARGKFYFEYTPSIYVSTLPDALRASLGPDDPAGWLFVPFGGLDLLSFRIGCRWPL